MIKYLCSTTDKGVGDMAIGNTPEEAFNEYKNYFDALANIEELFFYSIDCELQGRNSYVFKPVGT